MKLIKLEESTEAAYLKYIEEFKKCNELPFSSMLTGLEFQDFIDESRKYEIKEFLKDGYVPSYVYFLLDDNGELLGNIWIRTELNEALKNIGGHIGYVIVPFMRGMGYGKLMLKLALGVSTELGLSKVLITCDKDNLASARTIQRNGGILDSEDIVEGVEIQRYWISI